MTKNKNHVVILASGGIDSTACIQYYKNLDFDITLTFFDYGQLSKKNELQAISKIAKFYQASMQKIAINGLRPFQDGLLLGRNAAFYFTALMNSDMRAGIISSGIHYGTGYYDCSKDFMSKVNDLVSKYSDGTMRAEAPFLELNKRDIFEYCKDQKVPLHLTYSCELGRKQPCGICSTCKDLITIYAIEKHNS